MAAIFIVAGLAIADRVEKRKQAKRDKKQLDELRYRELQVETSARLARTRSGSVIDNRQLESPGTQEKPQQHGQSEQREEEEEDSASVSGGEDNVREAVDDAPPPAYEDAVAAGERREREWRLAQTARRRRSSALSQQSGGRGAASYVRMG